ncbi:MAG: SGNH/GDSL hydrolase family protein [Mucilaginibacter sp.]
MKWFSALLIVTLFACNKKTGVIPSGTGSVDSKLTAPPVVTNDSVSYLALGDSYTYGVGLSQDQSYPFQLATQLKGENYLAKDPLVIAFQGWKAGDLLAGIAAHNITKKFDFVTILIGVNDQDKGTDPKLYAMQLDSLINEATAFANGYGNRVFVISIPDWSVTPFATGMNISQIKMGVALFNSINEAESKRLGANYVDISAISEQAATDPTLTGSDGLHPSAKGYSLWVNQLQGSVIASFK